jgi:hypothetical protein
MLTRMRCVLLVGLTAVQAQQTITLPSVPTTLPVNASHSLDRSLMSFSMEFAYLNVFGGNNSAPNELTRALIKQLESRTGVGPDVRPGGITMFAIIIKRRVCLTYSL